MAGAGDAIKRLRNLAGLATREKPAVGITPSDVVFSENKWRLLRYRPRPEGLAFKTPIVMVPSLINRHYVLDLMPGKSFAEYLVARGHDVYCLDWGTPGDEDRLLAFDDFADTYLRHALGAAARVSGVKQVHLFGYCLGGTLAVLHAARRPEKIRSLSLLAAPVRFDDDGLLSRWMRNPSFDAPVITDGFGNVPWQLMQGAFQLLRPTLPLSKAVHVLDRAWDDEYLDGFLALETWGNDNVSFPGNAWREYVERLYRDDLLHRGALHVAGQLTRMEDITAPVLAVAFQHDNIVPAVSAAELTTRVASADKELWTLPGGHVGAVVSRSASKGLWPRLSGWWAARD